MLDVKYRHLVFTLPWQLRLLIQDNRDVLLPVLFRAEADSILSLPRGTPEPRGRKSKKWRERCRRTPCMRQEFIVALHTFGSDLNSKRPAIAEGRIVHYHKGYVGILLKDYYKDGSYQFKSLPVLTFIHYLVQHLTDRYFHGVSYSGLFAPVPFTRVKCSMRIFIG